MTKGQLALALSATDTTDRDILERLVTGYFRSAAGTKRIAATFRLDPHEVFHRLERMRLLGLVSIMKNANYDVSTKKYDEVVPGPSIGWFYSGGLVSEFFELLLGNNFA